MTTATNLPISAIDPAHSYLRPVRENTVEFLELVDSIREHGILLSILVQPTPVEGRYEVVDGMWRLTAAKQAGLEKVPVVIQEKLSEEQYLSLQLQANVLSYETSPLEYAEQMQRIIKLREEVGIKMTLSEMAKHLGKNIEWVKRRLSLLNLVEEAKTLLADEKITLRHAIALARVKRKHQYHLFKQLMELEPREFELYVGNYINLHIERFKNGEGTPVKPDLVPYLRPIAELLDELDKFQEIPAMIAAKGLTNPLDAAKMTLEWVLHLDPDSRKSQLSRVRAHIYNEDRIKLLGRQRYEELEEIRKMRQDRLRKHRDQI